jgi:hypothetical protein
MKAYTRPLLAISAVACAVANIATASPTRDTTLDHRLPPHQPPVVQLDHYRSAQERDGQNPELAVAMAISGGGHRAANFAVGVMLGLEAFLDTTNGVSLLNEVDYFSSVSGGGFAAGAYVASRHDYHKTHGNVDGYRFAAALERDKQRLLASLKKDYQSTLLVASANVQLIGYKDAGDLLEKLFDDHILGARGRADGASLTLGDIFCPAAGTNAVRHPYWFANATVYENGARFTFTPDMLNRYHVREFTHRLDEATLGDDACNMPFAVAVKTSASFPVAIPATTFVCANPDDPLNDYLHLMDGGLVDNLGVRTALDVLRQDNSPRRVLLVVDAYKGDAHPLSKTRISPSGPQAAYRITKIALDADHSLLKRNVLKEAAAAGGNGKRPIDVIFLSFEDLKPAAQTRVEDISQELARLRKQKAEAVLRRVQREVAATLRIKELALKSAQDEYALYHDARAIATSLLITSSEQQLLLKIGKAAVVANRGRLQELLLP